MTLQAANRARLSVGSPDQLQAAAAFAAAAVANLCCLLTRLESQPLPVQALAQAQPQAEAQRQALAQVQVLAQAQIQAQSRPQAQPQALATLQNLAQAQPLALAQALAQAQAQALAQAMSTVTRQQAGAWCTQSFPACAALFQPPARSLP